MRGGSFVKGGGRRAVAASERATTWILTYPAWRWTSPGPLRQAQSAPGPRLGAGAGKPEGPPPCSGPRSLLLPPPPPLPRLAPRCGAGEPGLGEQRAGGGSFQSCGQPRAQRPHRWAAPRRLAGSGSPGGSEAHGAQPGWAPGPRGAQGPEAHRQVDPGQEAGGPGQARNQAPEHAVGPACWRALSCGSSGTRAP